MDDQIFDKIHEVDLKKTMEDIRQLFKFIILLKLMFYVNNMFQALQEPDVNPRELLNTFNGVAFLKGLSNGEDTSWRTKSAI